MPSKRRKASTKAKPKAKARRVQRPTKAKATGTAIAKARNVLDVEIVDSTPADDQRARRLLQSWLRSMSPLTQASYRGSLSHFAAFVRREGGDAKTPLDVARGFLLMTSGQAFEVVSAYRTFLVDDLDRAPRTVIREISTLKSLVKHAKQLDFINYTLTVKLPKKPRRDERKGCGVEQLVALQRALNEVDDVLVVRDRAVLALLVDNALRRFEVCGLDLEHLDLDLPEPVVHVLGKGESEREPVPLAPQTVAALRLWLASRGADPGALFFGANGHGLIYGQRFSRSGLWNMLRRRSFRANLPQIRPHQIRHTTLSYLADQGVSLPQLQAVARHRWATTTSLYIEPLDDHRREHAVTMAAVRTASPEPDTSEPEQEN